MEAMKKHIFLLLVGLFFVLSACGDNTNKIKEASQVQEIHLEKKDLLVERNVSNIRPFWCAGNEILTYYVNDPKGKNSGVVRYDITTGSKTHVTDYTAWPLACTPDGRWLIYMDKANLYSDDGPNGSTVLDLWRYEFATEKREKIAVSTENAPDWTIFSPDGTKLFLSKELIKKIEMPEPRWEKIRTKGESGYPLWFKDSSTVVSKTYIQGERADKFNIKTFKGKEKTFVVDPDLGVFVPKAIDNLNRIYIRASNNRGENARLLRCEVDIKSESISCKTVLRLSDDRYYYFLDFLRDGKTYAFAMRDGHCIKITEIGSDKAECITANTHYSLSGYTGLSPNKKRLAFMASRKKKNGGLFNDLYISNLK